MLHMDWIWAGPPVDIRRQFPAERAALLALLADLDPADWKRPTVCPGWRVHDIVAHIAHDYVRKLATARDRYDSPGPRPGEDLPALLHRLNQEFVDVASRWSPRVLADLIGHLGPQLDEYWAGLDMDRLGEAVSWAAPGVPAPAWLDVGREYSEYWVHQQQIRDAVGRPGADSAALTAPVTDIFLRAVPHALRDVPTDAGASLEITVSGQGGGTWSVPRGAAGWAIGPGPATDPAAARVAVTADTLWRVATRGITESEALAPARGVRHERGAVLAANDDPILAPLFRGEHVGKDVAPGTLAVRAGGGQHLPGPGRQERIRVDLAVRVRQGEPISAPRFSKQKTCSTCGRAERVRVRSAHASITVPTRCGVSAENDESWSAVKHTTPQRPLPSR